MDLKTDRDKIKKRIKELGYTHAGVATRAQISPHTLHHIVCNPKYGTPGPFTRKRLASVLEVDESVIFPPTKDTDSTEQGST